MSRVLTFSLSLIFFVSLVASFSVLAENAGSQTSNGQKSQTPSTTPQSSPKAITPEEREAGEEGDVPRLFEFDNPLGPVILAAIAGGAIVGVLIWTKKQKVDYKTSA